MSPLSTLAACSLFFAGAYAADLDITGTPATPARVRFLDSADAEHTVLEGSEGWLNASTRVAAHDFVSANGVSLDALGRRLEDDASLQAIIVSLQATLASQQATISQQAATISQHANWSLEQAATISQQAETIATSSCASTFTPSTSGQPTTQSASDQPATRAKDLTSGHSHVCLLAYNSSAQANVTLCFGTNVYGQLGLGDTNPRWRPTPLDVSGTVAQIVAGWYHTCLILSTGVLECFGRNDNGQLGLNDASNRNVPTVVAGVSNVVHVALGEAHTCALTASAVVWCWGQNADGELGTGDQLSRIVPTEVTALGTSVRQLALGGSHSCALLVSSQMQCWGSNSNGQLGLRDLTSRSTPTTVNDMPSVIQLALGKIHTCTVNATSAVWCWGYNYHGQVGSPRSTRGCDVGDAHQCQSPIDVELGGRAIHLAVSSADSSGSSCALVHPEDVDQANAAPRAWDQTAGYSAGQLFCWGSNSEISYAYGSLVPFARYFRQYVPVGVGLFRGTATHVARGHHHTCVILMSGQLECFGSMYHDAQSTISLTGSLDSGGPYSLEVPSKPLLS